MAVILLRALQSPRPVVLTAAEQSTVDAALADRDNADFYANIGPTTTYYWLHQYDQVVTAPDFATDFMIQWEHRMPGFVNSPRFKEAVRRQGIDRYWREHGFPPQCRAAGKGDFTCD
jgi:hypothetical protein